MLLKIRHALLEVTNHPNTKQSAIVINNELVITSAHLLQEYVRPIRPFVADYTNGDVCASTKIIHQLQQCQLLNTQFDSEESRHLNSLHYQVTFERRKLPESRQARILMRYRAKLLYVFSSAEVAGNLRKFLKTTDSKQQEGEYNDVLLSSFVVLSLRLCKEKETFERFLQHIGHYLRYLYPIRPLDDVLTMCTPFGMENFYKTVSIGKISNVMGRNDCLFVLSNPLPLGCEGSAVFNSKLRLIGLIICTSFLCNNENVNLTLAANFACLLGDFTTQLGATISIIKIHREPSNFAWERTMVVILTGGGQGTGTFVRVRQKKFILTCTHVVFKVDTKVLCRSADREFECDVLWSNPHFDKPYDVALLTAPNNIPESWCVRLSTLKPTLGQRVYNAGFPYFVNFNSKFEFNPSIFQGRIIKYTNGAIFSDGSVQAGQSGGPMFDQNGSILGVCVSNVKVDNVVYPNVNTAVPIYQIRDILENYVKTNDLRVLNNLVANQDIQRIWCLEVPHTLSKL